MGNKATFEDPTGRSYEPFTLQGSHSKSLTVTVQGNQTDLQIKIDIGAAVSLISKNLQNTVVTQNPAETQGI